MIKKFIFYALIIIFTAAIWYIVSPKWYFMPESDGRIKCNRITSAVFTYENHRWKKLKLRKITTAEEILKKEGGELKPPIEEALLQIRFAEKIKQTYPVYKKISNFELVQNFLRKHPDFQERFDKAKKLGYSDDEILDYLLYTSEK
jgi:hypothetical protein